MLHSSLTRDRLCLDERQRPTQDAEELLLKSRNHLYKALLVRPCLEYLKRQELRVAHIAEYRNCQAFPALVQVTCNFQERTVDLVGSQAVVEPFQGLAQPLKQQCYILSPVDL